MDTFDAIYARRAVKHYDPNHTMPEADLKQLFEAAIQSPSSFNIQHWRFVVRARQRVATAASSGGERSGTNHRRLDSGGDDGRRAGLEEGSVTILARRTAGGGEAAG